MQTKIAALEQSIYNLLHEFVVEIEEPVSDLQVTIRKHSSAKDEPLQAFEHEGTDFAQVSPPFSVEVRVQIVSAVDGRYQQNEYLNVLRRKDCDDLCTKILAS